MLNVVSSSELHQQQQQQHTAIKPNIRRQISSVASMSQQAPKSKRTRASEKPQPNEMNRPQLLNRFYVEPPKGESKSWLPSLTCKLLVLQVLASLITLDRLCSAELAQSTNAPIGQMVESK